MLISLIGHLPESSTPPASPHSEGPEGYSPCPCLSFPTPNGWAESDTCLLDWRSHLLPSTKIGPPVVSSPSRREYPVQCAWMWCLAHLPALDQHWDLGAWWRVRLGTETLVRTLWVGELWVHEDGWQLRKPGGIRPRHERTGSKTCWPFGAIFSRATDWLEIQIWHPHTDPAAIPGSVLMKLRERNKSKIR